MESFIRFADCLENIGTSQIPYECTAFCCTVAFLPWLSSRGADDINVCFCFEV